MNCNQVNELLVEYLLNELNEETKSAIDRHLQNGCPQCIAEEREVLVGIDYLLSAIPYDDLSNEQRIAILASTKIPSRILLNGMDSYTVNALPESPVRLRPNSFPIVAYFVAFAAGILLMMTISPIHLDRKASVKDSQVNSSSQASAFAVAPSTIPQDSEMSGEKHSKKLLVSMRRADNRSKMEGRILWDALSNEVHFFGSGIERPQIGMQYVFWLIGDENRPPLAKELKFDPSGKCKVTAANPFGKIRFVLITLEATVGRIDRPSENIELTLDAIGLNSTRL